MEAPHHFIAILGKTGNPQSARVPSIVGRRLGRTHEHRRRVPCETAIEYRAAGNPDAKLAPRRGAGSASRWVCCVKWASTMAGADQLAGRTTPSYRAILKFRPTLTADPRVSLLFMIPRRREASMAAPRFMRIPRSARIRDAGRVPVRFYQSPQKAFTFSAKTLVHSRFWSADAQVPPSELPSTGGAIRKCGAFLGRA
jgi:hypothetical protein